MLLLVLFVAVAREAREGEGVIGRRVVEPGIYRACHGAC